MVLPRDGAGLAVVRLWLYLPGIMDKNPYIEKAIEKAGGQVSLAEKVGVSQASVSNWLRGTKRIRLEHALAVEAVTGGRVRAVELRPDLSPVIERILPSAVA